MTGTQQPFQLRELIGLLDEIGALVRSGAPLADGLRVFADGQHEVAIRLATRMEQGATLDDAFAQEGGAVPPVVRAVVSAGLKTNRLSSAIEGTSRTSVDECSFQVLIPRRAVASPSRKRMAPRTASTALMPTCHR